MHRREHFPRGKHPEWRWSKVNFKMSTYVRHISSIYKIYSADNFSFTDLAISVQLSMILLISWAIFLSYRAILFAVSDNKLARVYDHTLKVTFLATMEKNDWFKPMNYVVCTFPLQGRPPIAGHAFSTRVRARGQKKNC